MHKVKRASLRVVFLALVWTIAFSRCDAQSSTRGIKRTIHSLKAQIERALTNASTLDLRLNKLESIAPRSRAVRKTERRLHRVKRRGQRLELRMEKALTMLAGLTEGIDSQKESVDVSAFFLVDTVSDQELFEITDGMQIEKSLLPTMELSIVAKFPEAESVVTILNGDRRVENFEPYAFYGDNTQGDYWGKTFKAHYEYFADAEAFSKKSARGKSLSQSTVTFMIVERGDIFDEEDELPPDQAVLPEGMPLEEETNCSLENSIVSELRSSAELELVSSDQKLIKIVDGNGCSYTEVSFPFQAIVDLGAVFEVSSFFLIAGGDNPTFEESKQVRYSVELALTADGDYLSLNESVKDFENGNAFEGRYVKFIIESCNENECGTDSTLLLNELIVVGTPVAQTSSDDDDVTLPVVGPEPISALTNETARLYDKAPFWADSFEVNGKCYCESTYDHGLENRQVVVGSNSYSVPAICRRLGAPPPSNAPRAYYNTIQCGHGPINDAPDETECPGQAWDDKYSGEGCQLKGAKWDLSNL